VTFWPRIGLLGARLRNLYKHKLLGGFLEAQNRKSAFWTKKVGNFAPKPDFRGKSVFRAKSWNFAKMRKMSRNVTFFALKRWSENDRIHCIFGHLPKGLNLVKFIKFPEIPQNLVKFAEFCGISAFLRKNAIRAKMTKNASHFAL